MKLLIVSGLAPKKGKALSGIFITRRLLELKNKGIDFDCLIWQLYDSFFVKVLKRIFGKYDSIQWKSALVTSQEKEFPFILFKYHNLKRNLSSISKRYKEKRIMKFLMNCITEEIKLIHAHWVYPHGYIALKLGEILNKPVVVTAHGSDIHTNPKKNKFIMKRTIYTLENSDKAIFVSEALKKKAIDLGYSGNNSIVIPNGIDKEIFTNISKENAKKRIGLDSNKKYIGYVGNLVHVKGVDRLPLIFERISKKLPVSFIIVGDGELKEEIKKNCEKRDLDVLFTGYIKPNEVPLYMNAMEVLVLPSRNEGFGCVAIEAQACGVPVVGTDVGGIPEAIGNGGLIVPDCENFEERFAEAVVKELENPRDSSELRSRALKYDWSNIVEKEIDVYKEIYNKLK